MWTFENLLFFGEKGKIYAIFACLFVCLFVAITYTNCSEEQISNYND